MPALTTFIAVAGVAAAVGGTVAAKVSADKQAKAAKKQAAKVKAAALAKPPSTTTDAEIKLARADQDRRRGKGSLAARRKASALEGQSAASVGGL